MMSTDSKTSVSVNIKMPTIVTNTPSTPLPAVDNNNQLRSRPFQGILVHEVDEGQPCLACGDRCSGFMLHGWRYVSSFIFCCDLYMFISISPSDGAHYAYTNLFTYYNGPVENTGRFTGKCAIILYMIEYHYLFGVIIIPVLEREPWKGVMRKAYMRRLARESVFFFGGGERESL